VLQTRVMDIQKRVLEPEHPHTLVSMSNLALTFWKQGRWKEAEELQVQVKEIQTRVLGSEHPSTLKTMSNLAATFMTQGRLKEAEKLLIPVKETTKRILGEEHPFTLNSMSSIASIYRNQGRLNEAEQLGVQLLETKKEGARRGAHCHIAQYGSSDVDIWISRPMERVRTVGSASDGDVEEGARRGASFDTQEHVQPGTYLESTG
jgi:tetratricopeptide repeat protein